uniref:Homeobox protein Hox-D13-like n=1 Tax=Petromyzon marinus TaxID=7757 RepID=A0AAJ7WLS8_PETMA|nr:homeobox protein Hox-D13-like [Petromyzon marinus]
MAEMVLAAPTRSRAPALVRKTMAAQEAACCCCFCAAPNPRDGTAPLRGHVAMRLPEDVTWLNKGGGGRRSFPGTVQIEDVCWEQRGKKRGGGMDPARRTATTTTTSSSSSAAAAAATRAMGEPHLHGEPDGGAFAPAPVPDASRTRPRWLCACRGGVSCRGGLAVSLQPGSGSPHWGGGGGGGGGDANRPTASLLGEGDSYGGALCPGFAAPCFEAETMLGGGGGQAWAVSGGWGGGPPSVFCAMETPHYYHQQQQHQQQHHHQQQQLGLVWKAGAAGEVSPPPMQHQQQHHHQLLVLHPADPAPRRSRKRRVPYSKAQLRSLEREFAACRFVTRERRRRVAALADLTERQVTIWFQNRRVKEKKLLGRGSPAARKAAAAAASS